MEVNLEIMNRPAVDKLLTGAHERVMNLKPIFEMLVVDVHAAEKKQFDTSGAYGGEPWEPLSADWVARKIRRGQDPRILRMTGALELALTARGPGSVVRIKSDELFVGTSRRYGRAQKRKVMAVSEADMHEMVRRVFDYIVHGTLKS